MTIFKYPVALIATRPMTDEELRRFFCPNFWKRVRRFFRRRSFL